MVAARDESGIPTTNVAWTMVQSVFLAFRRRLTVAEAVRFANVLPPLIRAMFLEPGTRIKRRCPLRRGRNWWRRSKH